MNEHITGRESVNYHSKLCESPMYELGVNLNGRSLNEFEIDRRKSCKEIFYAAIILLSNILVNKLDGDANTLQIR